MNPHRIRLNDPFYDPDVTPRSKKYSVYVINTKTGNPKLIHFGNSNYEQYMDSTGLGVWSDLDHLDRKRRKNYLARAKGIKNKQGKLTWKDKNSPNFYSIKYLW